VSKGGQHEAERGRRRGAVAAVVEARRGVSGGTERRSREWDEVRWGAAMLGVPFICRRTERRGQEAGGR
jgi:hypothetical protein